MLAGILLPLPTRYNQTVSPALHFTRFTVYGLSGLATRSAEQGFFVGVTKMQVANLNSNETITTIELRELVNAARKAAGENPIRNDDFVA